MNLGRGFRSAVIAVITLASTTGCNDTNTPRGTGGTTGSIGTGDQGGSVAKGGEWGTAGSIGTGDQGGSVAKGGEWGMAGSISTGDQGGSVAKGGEWGTAGSIGTGEHGGILANGGQSGATCATRLSGFPSDSSGSPAPIRISGTGSSILSLDARTANGWSVSLVSGDLPSPSVLNDEGHLSNLIVGDQIEVTARQSCMAYSGCKSFVIVRDAKDHSLITANLSYDPNVLTQFADLLDIGLELEPVCTLAPVSNCYENEIQTQYRVLVKADDTVAIDQHMHKTVTIGSRSYTIWVGAAFTNTASGPLMPGTCIDAAGFWWSGAVMITIGVLR